MNLTTLYFAKGNAKLKKSTLVFSLPAGHTCPFAALCKSTSDRLTGKIKDGPLTQFRCYATGAEALFPNIRASRWNNLELLKQAGSISAMADLIEASIFKHRNIAMVRFHQSGDFFSQAYFDAWLKVAIRNPSIIFYGYTKAIPFWSKRLDTIPANLRLVASMGGTHDELAHQLGLRTVRVVFTEKAAADLGLPIDHDDSHVWNYAGSFAILLHGTQPKGSEAGKAWWIIKNHGRGGYKADYFAHYAKHKGERPSLTKKQVGASV